MSDTAGRHLVALSAATIRRLADEPTAPIGQSGLAGLTWPVNDARVLQYRLAALAADPAGAPYLLHAIVEASGDLVGRIGCHCGPDASGEVEIGYFVRPSARGRGVASWVVDTFLGWLADAGVRSVVASVRPDNAPSLAILRPRGFAEFGGRVDDEDGPELLLRKTLPSRRTAQPALGRG